jgi:hypothetical protein
VTTFDPDARQKAIIEEGLAEHRQAQASGRPAPNRLLRKWNSEAGIESPESVRAPLNRWAGRIIPKIRQFLKRAKKL